MENESTQLLSLLLCCQGQSEAALLPGHGQAVSHPTLISSYNFQMLQRSAQVFARGKQITAFITFLFVIGKLKHNRSSYLVLIL